MSESSPASPTTRSFVALLGLRIDRPRSGAPGTPAAVVDPESVRTGGNYAVSVDIEPHHRNGNAAVHGSVYHALLDTCMGLEAFRARGNLPVATAEISVRFLTAVTDGTLVARARVLKAGKRLLVCEGEIRRGEEVVAVAQGTFAAIKT